MGIRLNPFTGQFDLVGTAGGGGTVTNVTATGPLQSTGGATPNISISQSGVATDGYLSSVDWNTFNNKQPAGNYITDLTGDVTATGPGSVAAAIANNAVTNAKLADMPASTIKGNNTGGSSDPLDLTTTQINTLLGTITSLTGDVTATGPGASAATLANTAVTPGSYTLTNLTVDSKGRLTTASNGTVNLATQVTGTLPIANGGTGQTTANSALNALLPSQATNATKFLQTDGTNTSWTAGNAGTVTSVGTGTGLTGGPITTTGTISLANTAVTPGSYTLMSATVDAQGRLTAASSGTAVTSVASGTGLTGGPITTTGTLSLANTAVTPGAYTNTNLTVDAQGRITAASNGTNGTVTSVGLALPSIFTVTGSPVTTSGTLTGTLATQTANTVFAGPASGGAATPSFRALSNADIPALAFSTKTANYSMTTADRIIFLDPSGGPFTLTLPNPTLMGGIILRLIGTKGLLNTNNVTLARFASEKIEGLAANKLLQTDWGFWQVVSDGTDWYLG